MSTSKRPVFPSFGNKGAPSNGGASQEKPQSQSVISQFRAQIKKGMPVNWDTTLLAGVVDAIKNSDAIDDRKLLLEHVLTVLSKLPENPITTKLTNATVELLYNDLPHPPATYLGHKYQWRTADGSYNNVSVPEMGQAGTPYARSVQQANPLPKNTMPDAGLVFDTLLKRENFVEHPAGLSSLMFAFAALVIHTVFRTSHDRVHINDTTSYVDLSPLYGANQAEQDSIRKRDGRGLLFPDTFAEDRLLLLPPSVCVILVLFSRNHNYIAERLLEINERGTWIDPSKLTSGDPKKNARLVDQEEEIFQTARLINCAWFGAIVFSDYFSCILGLVRQGSSWSLNPFGEIRNMDHSFFERGRGNVCSVEFNCLYRWHATTSAEDEKWVELSLAKIFEGKNPQTLTVDDFKTAAQRIKTSEPDIHHWTFGAMQRHDGVFKDEELANVLHNATEHPAGAFRARGTPSCMRAHEIMGIESNRNWGVCSLNDFRKFLGLKPYGSFKEWNPDPVIHEAAEKLYGHIDHLELYVGLQAEEAKPVVEGAGLCPGYTISRAILADAIALTRGDRFFTADFTPYNLTAWGFADCQRDPSGFGFGSMFGRLLLRTLPKHFTYNSVYTWFPLMVPQAMKPHLEKLEVLSKYDVTRPGGTGDVVSVTEYAGVSHVLKNPGVFKSYHYERASHIVSGDGFYIAAKDEAKAQTEGTDVHRVLAIDADKVSNIGRYFYLKTRDLIEKNTFVNVGGKVCNINLVRDVLRVVPLHWAAGEIAGLRLGKEPDADYNEKELFDMIGDIYSYIFLDVERAKLSNLRDKAHKHIDELLRRIKLNLVLGHNRRLSVPAIVGTMSQLFNKPTRSDRYDFLRRLRELGHEDRIANSILAILVGATVELSLSLTNIINVFLSDEEISKKVSHCTAATDLNDLKAYVAEALRLDPPFHGVHRNATKAQEVGPVSVKEGHKVFVNIAAANLEEATFKGAKTVDITRTKSLYVAGGDVATRCLGEGITTQIMADVVRAIFSHNNVRRGPGQSGHLTCFATDAQPMFSHAYLDGKQNISPWPTSLIIQYDSPSEKKS